MRIKVMADVASTGLWDMDDRRDRMIKYEELDIPKELELKIDKWIIKYGRMYRSKKVLTQKLFDSINKTGREIAKEIKALNNQHSVMYLPFSLNYEEKLEPV